MAYPELDNLGIKELINRFIAINPDDAYAASFRDEVALRMRNLGEKGKDALLELLSTSDDLRAASILLAFSSPPADESAVPLLRAYLGDARPRVLMEVIDGLWYVGDHDAHDRIVALRNHESPYVRGAVLRYLRHLFPDEALSHLRTGLTDPHFVVRESAIDELDELGSVEVVDDIRPLLNDAHADVRQAARTAIANLERQDSSY